MTTPNDPLPPPDGAKPEEKPEEKKPIDSTDGDANNVSQVLVDNMRMLTRHLQGVVVSGMTLFALVRQAARRHEVHADEPEATSPRRRRDRRHDVEP